MDIKNILIVDDSEDDILVTTLFLASNKNYNLLTANNGKDAYEITISNTIDLILMDWEMPDLSGLETIVLIKSLEKNKEIPIIILTGRKTDSVDLANALDSGAVDYIRKPLQINELNARIRSVFRIVEYQEKILRIQNQIYNQEVKFKENEIFEKSLQLAQFSNFIEDILKKLTDLSNSENENINQELNSLKNSIQINSKKQFWNDFEIQFDNLNSEFYKKLLQNFPDLSPNERKLCAFLKMNLSSKEIANITFQNINAIDVARYRLRHKLGLTKEQYITNFLLSI